MHTHTRTSRSRVDVQKFLELFHKVWVITYIMAQFAFPVNDEVLVDAHVCHELLGIREFGGGLHDVLFLMSKRTG